MKYKRIKLIHRNIIQKREKRQIKWYHILISLFVILITLVQIKLHLFHKKSLSIKGGAFINQINYTDVITNYFGKLPKKFQSAINHELWIYRKYMRLKTLSPNKSSSSDQRAKIELYHSLGGKKYTKRKNIYIRDSWRFGNRMIMLSNMVYYIELLGEKKNIYINNAHHWFFKDKIVTDYVNIEMVNDTQMNCNDSETYCIQGCPWLITPQVIWPEIRMKVFKNELMKNLPKVKTSPKDLYIHIRSGDIYSSYYVHRSYPQPPLCFYKSILNHNKYRNAYIITENNKSPIIKKLVKEYPQIILNFNSLRNDLAVLINSYNLVGSVSSFVQVCLMLNDNIENYFEYDIYRKLEKFRHLHHDCYKYPRKFNIYKMKPSEYYKGEMYLWVNSPNQIKIMMEENCTYSDFQLTKN